MTSTGFASPEWLDQGSLFLEEDGVRVPLYTSRLRGLIPLLCTPLGPACGLAGNRPRRKNSACLDRAHSTVSVIDLGPGAFPDLLPQGWQEVRRHTRQLPLDDTFERLCPKPVSNKRVDSNINLARWTCMKALRWDEVSTFTALRETAKACKRNRKLEALLARIAPADWSFAVLATDTHGACIASGGFVILPDQTCVYAFEVKQGHKPPDGPPWPCCSKRCAMRTRRDANGLTSAAARTPGSTNSMPNSDRKWCSCPDGFAHRVGFNGCFLAPGVAGPSPPLTSDGDQAGSCARWH